MDNVYTLIIDQLDTQKYRQDLSIISCTDKEMSIIINAWAQCKLRCNQDSDYEADVYILKNGIQMEEYTDEILQLLQGVNNRLIEITKEKIEKEIEEKQKLKLIEIEENKKKLYSLIGA